MADSLTTRFQFARDDKLGAHGDVVIVGAGLAGLFTALRLAPMPVTVLAAAPLGEGAASAWSQAGIAAALGPDDSPELHAADTIAAGAGIVDERVARFVTEEGPARVADLVAYGVPFERDAKGDFVLSQEAAHSRRRVVGVSGDRAGASIMQALIAKVRATPSIRVLEGYEADDLIVRDGRVEGVRLVRSDAFDNSTYEFYPACAVVLATGGIGALFAVTTNPAYARGEAIAMAARAGAVIGDAEFVQFHPTAINVGVDPAPLATEALRGEGAILVNGRGERFLQSIDPRAELSPRDIVARGVFAEVVSGRGAFLDCRKAIGTRFPDAFPTVYDYCRKAGINPVRDLIPVAPAAHYHMGGIATDELARTSVAGLWAIGEVASTGLHGANRLASNSLLEAVVFAARAADEIRSLDRNGRKVSTVNLKCIDPVHRVTSAGRDQAIQLLRRTMMERVGVRRTASGLVEAISVLQEIEQRAVGDGVLANMALAARFVATSALRREESRGAQTRDDFLKTNPALARRSFLSLADLDCVAAAEQPAVRQAGCGR
jgi:L-aspartate oxidase